MLSIIYSDVIDFMEIQIHKVSKKLLRKSQYEDRYLELMSGLFVKFLNFYPNRYIGIESSLPEFLNKPEFKINLDLIDDNNIKSLLKDRLNQELYKIFINLFRRKKRKGDIFLNSNLLVYQNSLVDLIDEIIMKPKLLECDTSFQMFSDFMENNIETDIIINESAKVKLTDLDEMSILAFWQNSLTKKDKKLNEEIKKKDVNLIIGRFQPFNNNHVKICEHINKTTKIPNVIVQIINNKLNEKTIISKEISEEILEEIKTNYAWAKDTYSFNNFNFKKIIKKVSEKYNIKNVLCKDKLHESLMKEYEEFLFENDLDENQMNFVKLDEKELKLEERCSEKVRKAIKENDLVSYKRFMPQRFHTLFYKIKKED